MIMIWMQTLLYHADVKIIYHARIKYSGVRSFIKPQLYSIGLNIFIGSNNKHKALQCLSHSYNHSYTLKQVCARGFSIVIFGRWSQQCDNCLYSIYFSLFVFHILPFHTQSLVCTYYVCVYNFNTHIFTALEIFGGISIMVRSKSDEDLVAHRVYSVTNGVMLMLRT